MKKFASLFALVLVLSLVLSACGPTAAPAPTAAPTEAAAVETAVVTEAASDIPTLTLWVYDDTRLATLNQLGEDFLAEYGVAVSVEVVDLSEIRNAMSLGATTGEGPDMIIIPHDNLGPMVENASATEIDLGDDADKYLEPAVKAFTYNGKLYGLPLSVENIGFFYNTDLVTEAPKTWAEVAAIGTQLVKDGKAESAIGLPDLGYNIYPLYTAFGGYIFGRDADGNHTPEDIGMNNEGMAAALQWVKDLVDAGVESPTIDWEAAHVAFETGKTPFICTGPWAITRFKTAGIPYAIAAFPAATDGGAAGHPFMGVQGLVINAARPNVALAQTFADFLATEEHYQALFEADTRPSAWMSVFEGATDADTAAFNAAGVNADPMPSIPAMGFVWDAWTNAGNLVMTGEKTPAEALQTAVDQVLAGIAE